MSFRDVFLSSRIMGYTPNFSVDSRRLSVRSAFHAFIAFDYIVYKVCGLHSFQVWMDNLFCG